MSNGPIVPAPNPNPEEAKEQPSPAVPAEYIDAKELEKLPQE